MGWLDGFLGRTPDPAAEAQKRREQQQALMAQRKSDLAARKVPNQIRKTERDLVRKADTHANAFGGIADPSTIKGTKASPLETFFGRLTAIGGSAMNDTEIANSANYTKRQQSGQTGPTELVYNPVANTASGRILTFANALAEQFNPKIKALHAAEGYINPLGEMKKQWNGEKAITGSDAYQAAGVHNKVAATALGIPTDILSDWTTGFGGGYNDLTKAKYLESIPALKEGVDAAKLAELGVDTSKYAPEVRTALEAGMRVEDLPPQLAHEIANALHASAGQAIEGTARVAHAPFLRKITDVGAQEAGKRGIRYGAEVTLPWLRRVEPAEIAARKAAGSNTVALKLAELTGHGIKGQTFATPALKAAEAAMTTGEDALKVEHIARQVGTRVADQGGIKLFGQTVLPIQPTLDKLGYDASQTFRSSPLAVLEKAFNPVADIAKGGNELSTALAKDMLRARMLGKNLGKNIAINEFGVPLSEGMTDRERNLMSFGINEVQGADDKATRDLMVAETQKMRDAAEKASKRFGVDIHDPASVAEARGAVAGPAIAAQQKLEQVQTRQAELAQQAADVLDSLQAPEAGKSAYTVGRAGARAGGEAKGTGRALREVQGSLADQAREYELMADRASTLGEKADAHAVAAGQELPPGASTTMADKLKAKVTPAPVSHNDLQAMADSFSEPSEWEIGRIRMRRRYAESIANGKITLPEQRAEMERVAAESIGDKGWLYHSSDAPPEVIGTEGIKTRGAAGGSGLFGGGGGRGTTSTRAWSPGSHIYGENEYRFPASVALPPEEIAGRVDPTEIIISRDIKPQYIEVRNPQTGTWESLLKAEPAPVVGELSTAAGVDPNAYRTPLSLTPSGKPKRFETWQANLQDQIYGGATADFNMTAKRISKSGTADMGAASRMLSPEELAREHPEQAVDILAGRVRSALDAGDLDAARRYQGHLDDFAEWYSAPVVDPIFGDVLQAGETVPGGVPDVLGEAAAAPVPTEQAKAVVNAAMDSHDRVEAAYRAGRATGAREGSRAAARDAVRVERLSAKLEGRAANYQKVIDGLSTDAERFDAAAEALRGIEREQAQLGKGAAKYGDRWAQAQRGPQAVDNAIEFIGNAGKQADTLQEMTRQFVEGSIDYDRFGQFMVDHGVDPERAKVLQATAEQLRESNDALRQMKIAAGLPDTEKLGEGAGSAGYVFQTDPERPGLLESWLGIKPKAAQTRDEVIKEVTGVDPAMLRRSAPDNAAGFTTYARADSPKQPHEDVYETLMGRVKGEGDKPGGLMVQSDIAQAQAAKVERDYADVSKAQFQDELVHQFGWEINPNDRIDVGYAPYSITRNGETIHYAVPDRVAKWAQGIDGIFVADEATNKMFRAYDKVLNGWKRMATSWNPGFHGRNALSNFVLAYWGDAGDVKGWEQAQKVYALGERGADTIIEIAGRKQTAAEWRAEALALGVEKGTFGPSEVMETVQREVARNENTKTVGGILRHPFDTLDAIGGKFGTTIEDGSRLAVYFNSLEKGMAPESAAANVDRILYNYSGEALTPTERNGFKRLIPFYSWLRQNLPRMVNIALTQPGKFTQIAHLRNNLLSSFSVDPEDMPQYLRDTYAMPVGDHTLWQPGMPFADLERIDPSSPGDFFRGWLGGMAPPIKDAAELALNRDYFTNSDLKASAGSLAKAPGYVQMAEGALAGTPWWESLKTGLGMGTKVQPDGSTVVSMNPYAAKVLKDASPWLAKLAKTTDPTSKAKLENDLMYVTGIRLQQMDRTDFANQSNAARLKALKDEHARRKALGISK